MSRDDATKTRLNKLQSRGSGINPKTGRRFSANTSSRSSDTDKDFRGRSTDDSNIGRRAMFSGKSSTYGSSRGKGEQRRKLPYHKKESFQIKGETFDVYDFYKPLKILGHGAYAVVCEAMDLRTNKSVAIKKNKGVFFKNCLTRNEFFAKQSFSCISIMKT